MTPGRQWCHNNRRNSMGSGARWIIVQNKAPPPCNKVNQGQSDKTMRSWQSRYQRAWKQKYNQPARGKARSTKASKCGARNHRQDSVQLMQMKNVCPLLVRSNSTQRRKKLRATKHRTIKMCVKRITDTEDPMMKTMLASNLGERNNLHPNAS